MKLKALAALLLAPVHAYAQRNLLCHAQSLEVLGNLAMYQSLYGRKIGLMSDGTLGGAGVKDVKLAVQDLTSASTGTALNNYGVVNIAGTSLLTSGQIFLLSNPIPGIKVTINNVRANTTGGSSGSTALALSRPSTAFYIRSSEASTGVGIVISEGGSITLMGVSTDAYQAIAGRGVAAVVQGST